MLQELRDIADILAERGVDGEPDAVIDAFNAVRNTEWDDAVSAILSDDSLSVKTALANAIKEVED